MPVAINPRDGARIAYEDDGGAGAPVVVLGGFLDPMWLVRRAPVARALAETEGFRLVFIDHRGHGASEAPHDPSAYAMSTRVADVVAVLDALAIERAGYLGISWGARLGFGFAEHAPGRASSLVAIGQHPYALDPAGPLARVVGAALADPAGDGIEPLVLAFEAIAGRYPDDVRAAYLAADAQAMRAAWRAVLDEGPVSDRLGAWDVPCLIVVAEEDADFIEPARRAAGKIPGAGFVLVAGTDHLGMDSAPIDRVMPRIAATLRGTS